VGGRVGPSGGVQTQLDSEASVRGQKKRKMGIIWGSRRGTDILWWGQRGRNGQRNPRGPGAVTLMRGKWNTRHKIMEPLQAERDTKREQREVSGFERRGGTCTRRDAFHSRGGKLTTAKVWRWWRGRLDSKGRGVNL